MKIWKVRFFLVLLQQLIHKFNAYAKKIKRKQRNGIYHVMLRGINRQNIFYDIDDYECFLDLLRRQINPIDDNNKYLPSRCTVYAYCLMPNHVHLDAV